MNKTHTVNIFLIENEMEILIATVSISAPSGAAARRAAMKQVIIKLDDK